MATSYGSGAITANITGSVNTIPPTIPAGAVQVVRSTPYSTTAGATLYTVTAGKTLYITSVWINFAFNAAAQGTLVLQADVLGDASYRQLIAAVAKGVAGNLGTAVSSAIPFPTPVQVPATKIVQYVGTNPAGVVDGFVGFTGYEL